MLHYVLTSGGAHSTNICSEACPSALTYTTLIATAFLKHCYFVVKSAACALTAASEDQFVAFEGSMQLYTELLNHRPPSGAWQVATAGCSGLARIFARAQVIALLHVQMLVTQPCFYRALLCVYPQRLQGQLQACCASLEHLSLSSSNCFYYWQTTSNTFLFIACAKPAWLGLRDHLIHDT